MKGPLHRYKTLVKDGSLNADPAQEEAAKKLHALHIALRDYRGPKRGLFGRREAPQGIYLWGGVGRGKTLLMDLFFNNTPIGAKRRIHFHEFMIEAHERITAWREADDKTKRRHKAYDRKNPDDPIPYAAHDIAQDAMLLCFDEFQVSDIADAMILGRLFSALFDHGVVVVATSNRHPDDLYKDGLNRQLFLPFIELLKTKTETFQLQAAEDYRLSRLGGAPVYYQPLGPETDAVMDAAWRKFICGATEKEQRLTVKGRTLVAKRTARDSARFTFAELCETSLGANDYLCIARRFSTIFLDSIPIMSPESRNEAKRFVILIDALYDTRTKLVCSADGKPDDLYQAGDGSFEFERTTSRLIEMQSADYLGAEQEMALPKSDD